MFILKGRAWGPAAGIATALVMVFLLGVGDGPAHGNSAVDPSATVAAVR